eukprot:371665_1
MPRRNYTTRHCSCSNHFCSDYACWKAREVNDFAKLKHLADIAGFGTNIPKLQEAFVRLKTMQKTVKILEFRGYHVEKALSVREITLIDAVSPNGEEMKVLFPRHSVTNFREIKELISANTCNGNIKHVVFVIKDIVTPVAQIEMIRLCHEFQFHILTRKYISEWQPPAVVPKQYQCPSCCAFGSHWIQQCPLKSTLQILDHVADYVLDEICNKNNLNQGFKSTVYWMTNELLRRVSQGAKGPLACLLNKKITALNSYLRELQQRMADLNYRFHHGMIAKAHLYRAQQILKYYNYRSDDDAYYRVTHPLIPDEPERIQRKASPVNARDDGDSTSSSSQSSDDDEVMNGRIESYTRGFDPNGKHQTSKRVAQLYVRSKPIPSDKAMLGASDGCDSSDDEDAPYICDGTFSPSEMSIGIQHPFPFGHYAH